MPTVNAVTTRAHANTYVYKVAHLLVQTRTIGHLEMRLGMVVVTHPPPRLPLHVIKRTEQATLAP